MAYIQEKLKGKKIVSFKFKACVGRDDNGKQIFKCTTWYPPAELTPAKARKEAQKVAAIWEDEVRQAYLKEREETAVAGASPAYTSCPPGFAPLDFRLLFGAGLAYPSWEGGTELFLLFFLWFFSSSFWVCSSILAVRAAFCLYRIPPKIGSVFFGSDLVGSSF